MRSDGARLAGRTVVVVGAGAIAPGWSNGRACAVSYARAGASVVCVDAKLDSAEETLRIIKDEGGTGTALAADATSEADLAQVVEETIATYGRLDVMHNNVGSGIAAGTPDQVAPDLWDLEMALTLKTAYLGTRCAVPTMRRQGGGVIVNTSSLLAVRFLRRPNVAYSAAKAAVEAMTRACANAYGRDNIRVNAVRIGFSETPVLEVGFEARGIPEEQRRVELDKSRAKVPLRGEHTSPFSVAAAAVFLASDEARDITGVILNVDGGLECAPI